MTVQTIALDLPEDIYERLQRMAEATHQPVEEVMFQTIRGNLPPSVDDLPPELRDELARLQDLSDKALWVIAKEPLPPDQWRRHEHLLGKNQAGTLTNAEREEMARLRVTTDRFVFRRSYALALLKWRGYTLPISENWSTDASKSKDSGRCSPTGG
ncbi:MAG: hypothetical protein L6435_12475 [Anaerolineae bacterium]|nr:hypothetical protein [Anaerolineae bacterium]